MNEEDMFHEALARDPADRAAYLDGARAGDPARRASIDALLRANVGVGGFLTTPPRDAAVERPAAAEGPGRSTSGKPRRGGNCIASPDTSRW
jgi:hypothetical protein